MRLVALKGRLASLMQRSSPRLKGNIFDLDVVRQMGSRARTINAVRIHGHLNDSSRRPETFLAERRPEVQSAVRPTRGGAGAPPGLLPAVGFVRESAVLSRARE